MKLQVTDLNSFYGPAHALFDISFSMRAGEVLALLGRNGAGKTTTFRSIMGLMPKCTGQTLFDGLDISGWQPFEIARRGLGYVPEERRIFSKLTVEENLLIGQQPKRQDAPFWSPERLYELFPNLGEMRKRLGGRMSGGEQQMLTISRTLMGNPSLILLDEPSEGLAPKILEQMVSAILSLKSEGLSIVLSEQNLHFAKLIADRVCILEKGKVCFTGTMAELNASPEIRDSYLAI